jgi:hypothetical protein
VLLAIITNRPSLFPDKPDLSVAEIVYNLARIRRFVEGGDIDTKLVSDELPGTSDPIAGVSAFA